MKGAAPGRPVVLLLLLIAIGSFFLFGLGETLDIAALKARRAELALALQSQPLLVTALFALLYIVIVALSVPGATILTLAGGALFGLWTGVLIVSFASTIGAALAFLASRYLFRDWVVRRFGPRLAAIDRGLAGDGITYLLAIRLNPAIPFFLVNLGMGLTRMRLLTFALTSQIGMLPATIIYVNAGTELARIRSLADVASPELIGSLVLLSLFPLLGRAAARWLRRRRAWRGWKRPGKFDRNLVVIGAGAGGLVASYVAATARARVTLVERKEMGGECLNTGCVPSKALIRSARAAHEISRARLLGLESGPVLVDFPALMRRVRSAIEEIAPNDSEERYESLGVEVRKGTARIVDPWTVEVEGDRLTTRAIVIATGSEPIVPPVPGLDALPYLTTDTLWDVLAVRDRVPERLVLLGGGVIGVELAQAFARLGSTVTLVEAGPRILPREDHEAAAILSAALEADGVRLRTGTRALRAEPGGLLVAAEGLEERIGFDEIIVATGRRPRLTGLGLEELGIETGRALDLNEYLETRFPNVLAVGDAAGRWQLTHGASHEAWHAAINALFGNLWRFKVDYRVLPRAVYADPELAQVGQDEESARAAGLDVEVVRLDLGRLDRAVTDAAGPGLVKLLVERGRDRLVGATIVAPQASELIAIFALAMRHRIGLNRLLATVFTYPTLAEGAKLAAGEWRRAHAPGRLLDLAGAWHRWRRG